MQGSETQVEKNHKKNGKKPGKNPPIVSRATNK